MIGSMEKTLNDLVMPELKLEEHSPKKVKWIEHHHPDEAKRSPHTEHKHVEDPGVRRKSSRLSAKGEIKNSNRVHSSASLTGGTLSKEKVARACF